MSTYHAIQAFQTVINNFHNLVELYQKKEQKEKRKEERKDKQKEEQNDGQNSPIHHPATKSSHLDIRIAMARMARRFH